MLRSTEAATGRLGAVLCAARTAGVVRLGAAGPWLAATPGAAREVLTDPHAFDFPMDVSRRPLRASPSRASSGSRPARTPHATTPALTGDQVARGRATFSAALARSTAEQQHRDGWDADAMTVAREPVALAVCAAVLPGQARGGPAAPAAGPDHHEVADAALAWIDALAPVIAGDRAPRRWSRLRRAEGRARDRLHDLLARIGVEDPASVATVLAAGIQVPVAAIAWLLVHLATNPPPRAEGGHLDPWQPMHVVWETLRLTPPTWVTARLAAEDVVVAGERIAAGSLVLVSPLQLGQTPALVPHDAARPLDAFDPHRWRDSTQRPGAWLPFGAGPHACPGRSLGIALLLEAACWAGQHRLHMAEAARIDQSRGIFPAPSRLRVRPAQEEPS